MRSINIVILGDYSIASELGKKGTTSDLTIYDRKIDNSIYSFIAPTSFPEKIQPLMQAINMAEYAILNINKLDRYIGESIIALDLLRFRRGFIITEDELTDKVKHLISNTSLASFEFITLDVLKRRIDELEVIKQEGEPLIYIDHVFDVKGVGTVVLGILRRGNIKVYDELELMPASKMVTIKSIQLHGKDVDEASSPARVGLALKGIKVDEISRGDMLAKQGSLSKSDSLGIKFVKSNFFNEEVSEKSSYMLSLGLQVKSVKFKGDSLKAEKSIAYSKGEEGILLKPDSKVNRIVGKIIVLE